MTGLAPEALALGWFAGLLVLTGTVAGLLAGLLGVGGGIIIVPALYYLFDHLEFSQVTSMHVAVGTSLACIVPTSIASMRAHARRGAVDAALLRRWSAPVLVGAAAGVGIAGEVDGAVLTAVFATIALMVSANTAVASNGLRLFSVLPERRASDAALGSGIGVFSAMMGIGGGTLSVPVLTLFSYPMLRAVGTASALGLLIAVPGALGFMLTGLGVEDRPAMSVGYVNLLAVATLVPMTVTMAPLGAALAHRLDGGRLRQIFALFLLVTAVRMLTGLS